MGKLTFAELIHLASSSADDSKTLDRIVEYVTWAAGQTSDELASAVDLAFFLPMFREKRIYQMLQQRFPPDLLATKTKLLLEDNEAAAP